MEVLAKVISRKSESTWEGNKRQELGSSQRKGGRCRKKFKEMRKDIDKSRGKLLSKATQCLLANSIELSSTSLALGNCIQDLGCEACSNSSSAKPLHLESASDFLSVSLLLEKFVEM